MTVSEKTNQETLTRPPGKWVNWYLTVRIWRSEQTGILHHPGDKVPGLKVWPSKDAAMTAAAACCSDPTYASGSGEAIYLGAYPEGVTP